MPTTRSNLCHTGSESEVWKSRFQSPPSEYKPMPFWFINGELTKSGIYKQLKDAKELAGFTGVSPLPCVDIKPKFLSDEYFARYADIMDAAKELDLEVIYYDDAGFPSGMAGGKMEKQYPEHTRKRLDLVEKQFVGAMRFFDRLPRGKLMGAVAMHAETKERVDLRPFIKENELEWKTSQLGVWKVMYFVLVTDGTHKEYRQADYLDPEAVEHLITLTYDQYALRFGEEFGKTIKTVFFDDVGFYRYPRGWTARFNEAFEALNGYDPAPHYPALWYDVGPETEALRHAFFRTRAELLAEGFPKLVSEWAKKNGLKDTGHPPGNYGPNPVAMNGDIFKFYRYTAIPLMDSIIGYGYGQNGFKMISSAADYYDRPDVAVETYGAFPEETFNTDTLYRNAMDLFTRGVNIVIPHAMWNDVTLEERIPPLVSSDSEKIAADLPDYSEFIGRASFLLRGGRRVSDIAVLYPYEELAGWYRFEDPANHHQGDFVSPITDYLEISGLLSRQLRRDFTFVHPEFFLEEKYSLEDGRIRLNNQGVHQEYRAMIMTGSCIITPETLAKINAFYQQGGTVIATTQLPHKSTKIGGDEEVVDLVQTIFGIDSTEDQTKEIQTQRNDRGGCAVFIPHPNRETLSTVIDALLPVPDVSILLDEQLPEGASHLSYIHKVKDGRDIYYLSNSSDESIKATVQLRGRLTPQSWNPHTGEIQEEWLHHAVKKGEVEYTEVVLELSPIQSVFIVSQ